MDIHKFSATWLLVWTFITVKSHFGWNPESTSDAEMICEMILFAMIMQAISIWRQR